MLMTGKAEEYLDIWEAGDDPSKSKKTYVEFLNKRKDYARRRKWDKQQRRGCNKEETPWT